MVDVRVLVLFILLAGVSTTCWVITAQSCDKSKNINSTEEVIPQVSVEENYKTYRVIHRTKCQDNDHYLLYLELVNCDFPLTTIGGRRTVLVPCDSVILVDQEFDLSLPPIK